MPWYIFKMNTKSRLINLLFRLVKGSPETQESLGTEFRWLEWLTSALEFKQYLGNRQGVMKLFHLPFIVSCGSSARKENRGRS